MPEQAGKPEKSPIQITSEAFAADTPEAKHNIALLAETCRLLRVPVPKMEERSLSRGVTEAQAILIGAVMGHKGRKLESFRDSLPKKKALFDGNEQELPSEQRLMDIIAGAKRHLHLESMGVKLTKEKISKNRVVTDEDEDDKFHSLTQISSVPVPAAEQYAEGEPEPVPSEPAALKPAKPKRNIPLPVIAGPRTVPLTVIAAAQGDMPQKQAIKIMNPREEKLRSIVQQAMRTQIGEGRRFPDETSFDAALAYLYEHFHALDMKDRPHKGPVTPLGKGDSFILTPRQALVAGVALGLAGDALQQFRNDLNALFKDGVSANAQTLYPPPTYNENLVRQALEFWLQEHTKNNEQKPVNRRRKPEPADAPVSEAVPIPAAVKAPPAISMENPPKPAVKAKKYGGLPKEEIRRLMEEADEQYRAMGIYSPDKADAVAIKLFTDIASHYGIDDIGRLSAGTVNGKTAGISPTAVYTWRTGRNVNLDTVGKGCDALAAALLPEDAEKLANYLVGVPWKEKKTPKELLRFIEHPTLPPARKSGVVQASSATHPSLGMHELIHLAKRQDRMNHVEYAAKIGIGSSDLSRMAAPADSEKIYAQHRGNQNLNRTARNFGLAETDVDDIALFKHLARGKGTQNRVTQEELLKFVSDPAAVAMSRFEIIRLFLEKLMERHGFVNRGELADAIIAAEHKKHPEADIINRRAVLKQKFDNIVKSSGGIVRLPPDMANWLADYAFPAPEETAFKQSLAGFLQEAPGFKIQPHAERLYRQGNGPDTGTPG